MYIYKKIERQFNQITHQKEKRTRGTKQILSIEKQIKKKKEMSFSLNLILPRDCMV